jgi:hypothetical protein
MTGVEVLAGIDSTGAKSYSRGTCIGRPGVEALAGIDSTGAKSYCGTLGLSGELPLLGDFDLLGEEFLLEDLSIAGSGCVNSAMASSWSGRTSA